MVLYRLNLLRRRELEEGTLITALTETLNTLWCGAAMKTTKSKEAQMKVTIAITFSLCLKLNSPKKPLSIQTFHTCLLFLVLLPTTPPPPQTTHLQLHPAHHGPPHPVSKLGHASQPAAHTFLSSSSFWTLIHLWSDSGAALPPRHPRLLHIPSCGEQKRLGVWRASGRRCTGSGVGGGGGGVGGQVVS